MYRRGMVSKAMENRVIKRQKFGGTPNTLRTTYSPDALSFFNVAAVALCLVFRTSLGQTPPGSNRNSRTTSLLQEAPGKTAASDAANDRLISRIKARLEGDRRVLSYKIDVAAKNGDVILRGEVQSLLARERAAQIAATVPGVDRVRNNILVSVPQQKDNVIKGTLEEILANNPALQSSNLKVHVKTGFVIMSGLVGSYYRKELAENLAKGVPGVRGVENELRVDLLAHRLDQEIQRDVESKIQWDTRLENPEVQARVRNGTVTLIGAVQDPQARAQAIRDARVTGVNAVDASQLLILNAPDVKRQGRSFPDSSLP